MRLPDHIVEFLDGLVSQGKANSRAVVVTRALEREPARHRDAAILARAGEDRDLDSLTRHVARAPLDLE